MNEPRKLAMQVPFYHDMPDHYIKEYIRAEKIKGLTPLLDAMYHDRWWLIRFHEEWPTEYEIEMAKSYPYNEEWAAPTYRIYCDLREVHTEHFVIPEPVNMYEAWSTRRVALSAIDELKYRIKRKLKRE